jgi:hypothetical protein
MAQFKGTVYISTKIFAEQRFGPAAAARCLGRLDREHAAILEGVSAVGWYPVEPVLRYHHALQELYGEDDHFGLCEEAGRFSAKWALNTVIRVALRFKSPEWVLQKHAAVWERHHDSGRWEVSDGSSSKAVSGRLRDFQVQDPAFCARLRGWLHGAASMTGGQDVKVSEPECRCRGGQYCRFDLTWS